MASTGKLLSRTGPLAPLIKQAQQSCILTSRCQHRISECGSQVQMYSQDTLTSQNRFTFNEKTLEHLVCPLSKKDLRYDKESNELVCEEIGVAYPIVNGIPNLVPQDARMLKNSSASAGQDTMDS